MVLSDGPQLYRRAKHQQAQYKTTARRRCHHDLLMKVLAIVLAILTGIGALFAGVAWVIQRLAEEFFDSWGR